MGNRIRDWLQAEPVPRELRARVMGDRRLTGAPGGALRSRIAFATVALMVLLVGGGLGSVLVRGSRPGGAAGIASSPASSAAAATSPSPTASAPVVVPSAIPTMTPCRTADLDISIGRSQGAAGTIYVPVSATNHSSRSCSLSGYFGLALLDAAGKQIGADPRRDPNPTGTTPQAGPVVLAPAGSASFTFHWSDVQSGPQACPSATQVELTAPDQTDHVVIPARTADGMAIAPCTPGGTGLTSVQPMG